MKYFSRLPNLHTLILHGMNASLINGWWIGGLSSSLRELHISGELRWHTHDIIVMERKQMRYVGTATQIYL